MCARSKKKKVVFSYHYCRRRPTFDRSRYRLHRVESADMAVGNDRLAFHEYASSRCVYFSRCVAQFVCESSIGMFWLKCFVANLWIMVYIYIYVCVCVGSLIPRTLTGRFNFFLLTNVGNIAGTMTHMTSTEVALCVGVCVCVCEKGKKRVKKEKFERKKSKEK